MQDKLLELTRSMQNLDAVLRSIDPQVFLAHVEVGGGREAAIALSYALKRSPSFPSDKVRYSVTPVVKELSGVSISMHKENGQ